MTTPFTQTDPISRACQRFMKSVQASLPDPIRDAKKAKAHKLRKMKNKSRKANRNKK